MKRFNSTTTLTCIIQHNEGDGTDLYGQDYDPTKTYAYST
tara:strand:+ start:612 stop:731 length:120 start_codon:yes stop_codon:yes gene_type:complete